MATRQLNVCAANGLLTCRANTPQPLKFFNIVARARSSSIVFIIQIK